MTYEYTTEDIEYLRHDKPFKLRLYKPRGAGPFPAVVDLHGGAWAKGSLEETKGRDEVLAKNGILVASLDFRDDRAGSSLHDFARHRVTIEIAIAALTRTERSVYVNRERTHGVISIGKPRPRFQRWQDR